MTVGNGSCSTFRLKAKEKILIQLYLHRFDPNEGEFPFEVTQKGLADHLGLRRSHVAAALQELVKDGFVEAVKGHVEGEDRRQNAYCITSKGIDDATTVRERLLEVEVSFEDSDGKRTVKVSEIVTSRKASLASVINQMDRGGPVRDEIAVVTKPEKRQISVFCPTCKKQIEVDNVFFGEEVGFDCPGCGRPYRIVPAARADTPPEPPNLKRLFAVAAAALLALVAAGWFSWSVLPESLEGPSVIMLVTAGTGVLVWVLRRMRRGAIRRRTRVGAVASTIALSPMLLFIWHLGVASIDVRETATVLAPILIALVLAYLAVRRYLPEFRGDYLLTSGTAFVLVAAATMVMAEFGRIEVGMALAVAICGAVLVVLSTFHPKDLDATVLDIAMAIGVFLILLAAVLMRECTETIDYIALEATVILGAVLILMRVVRERLGVNDISSHLISAVPLTLASGLVIIGAFLIEGGETLMGIVEIAVASPFAIYGAREAFNENWPYRVPIVICFVAVLTLAVTAGFVT